MAPDTAADEIHRFEEQYRRNPEGLAFARLADAYRRTGDTDRALELLEEGIARHPDYASAFIIRARTYTDLARYEQAEEALRRVLDLDPQNQVAMLGLADLAERRGAVSEALGWQERIIAAYPQNEEAKQALERLRPLARRSHPGLDDLPPPAEEWWSSPDADPEPGRAAEGRSRPRPEDREDEDRETAAEEAPVYVGFDRLPDDVAGELDRLDDELAEPRRESEVEDDFVAEIFGSDADADVDAPPAAPPGIEELVAGENPPSDIPDALDDDLVGLDAPAPPSDAAPVAETPAGTGEREAWWFEDPSETEPVEDGDLLTRTMADLYARQGLIDEAASIYRELLAGRPDDPELLRALADVEARLAPEPRPEPEAEQPEPELDPEQLDPEPEAEQPDPEPEPGPVAGPVGDAPADVPAEASAADPYSTHFVPPRSATSEYFAAWLRRLGG